MTTSNTARIELACHDTELQLFKDHRESVQPAEEYVTEASRRRAVSQEFGGQDVPDIKYLARLGQCVIRVLPFGLEEALYSNGLPVRLKP